MEKLPKRAGVSLNPQHYKDLLETQPPLAWLEVAPEYYLGLGGSPHYYLEKLRKIYPLGFHSHILSIGSAESVNEAILNDVKRLLEIYKPASFVELLGWTRWQGRYLKMPMPLPYTDEALDQVSLNIKTVQNALGRRLLIENPAQYLTLEGQDMTEAAFFHELVRATGCGICLNVTHLYVSAMNFAKDPFKVFTDYPLAAISQLRLTGQKPLPLNNQHLLMVDAANGEVSKPVWRLYQAILEALPGALATSISWTDRPHSLAALLDLAEQADDALFEVHPIAARGATQ